MYLRRIRVNDQAAIVSHLLLGRQGIVWQVHPEESLVRVLSLPAWPQEAARARAGRPKAFHLCCRRRPGQRLIRGQGGFWQRRRGSRGRPFTRAVSTAAVKTEASSTPRHAPTRSSQCPVAQDQSFPQTQVPLEHARAMARSRPLGVCMVSKKAARTGCRQ